MNIADFTKKRQRQIEVLKKEMLVGQALPDDLDFTSLSLTNSTSGLLKLSAQTMGKAFAFYDLLKPEAMVVVKDFGTTSFRMLDSLSNEQLELMDATHVAPFYVNLNKLAEYSEKVELVWFTKAANYWLKVVCEIEKHNFKILKHDVRDDFGRKVDVFYSIENAPNGCEKISWAMGKDYPSYTFYWFNYGDDMHPSEVL